MIKKELTFSVIINIAMLIRSATFEATHPQASQEALLLEGVFDVRAGASGLCPNGDDTLDRMSLLELLLSYTCTASVAKDEKNLR
jgi:hypothetical protein